MTDEAAATVATPASGPPAGQRIGQLDALRRATLGEYDVLGELGHGGMATVYLAHDLALDRSVAIKVLAPALLAMGEGMVERFKREARTAAALSHPHIIPIYAVKESDEVLYFVMKYVQGRPLDAVIRDVGPLAIPMVQLILAQVSDALSYAHRHGVVHRDIKSANIMLDEEGWAVVTDFGIAKVLQSQGLTLTGVTVGTPTYMSPEQCAMEEVTGASDQYSLGVVAYEMLTGKPLFEGDSIMSVMYAHFNRRPRPVSALRPECPANLDAAVMRMLEKDPRARWPGMEDVVAVCGRPSLRQDDPVRSQMVTLARAGSGAQLLARMRTPTSPIPLAKPRTRATATTAAEAVRRSWLWWGLGAAGIAAALWFTAPWRRSAAPPPAAADSVAVSGRNVAAADTGPLRPAAQTAKTVAPARRSPARPPARVPGESPGVRPPLAAAADSTTRAAARPEDTLLGSMRATALAAMRRALDAGATPAEIAKGDTVFRAAESLAPRGLPAEAMVQFASAASLWTEAERASRARAARDVARQPPAEPPAPAPVTHPPADPRVEIKALIADYARALESRDVNEVRRVYPGLTSPEQETLRQFFASVPELKAGLTINRLVIAGASADVLVNGVYEYVDAKTGRSRRDTTTFRATVVQDSTGWHLTSIHSLR
ncbi:MAG: hypothetical protein AUI99_07590 [Gemmatimonadetes bacterium 13_1_40CM_3_69_22]|nr:MAG: hypothetical protein AUI99_07590 [Gemmatimonadetes bacterium 13_1_40CM_3_69_22]OLD93231.1 MAG: hypothetical protein AUG79_12400 [Gemmatimonadetes bacterium 13_1_20CM_4_69_16]